LKSVQYALAEKIKEAIMDSSRGTAEADLATSLKSLRDMGLTSEHHANLAVAKNVTNEELGRYGEHPLEYALKQKTKDTLLAHGRQDAAHALCNTKSILDQNAKISSRLNTLNWLMVVAVCMLGAIVAKLYPQFLPALH
jgi:hypothetical protein